MRWIIGIIVTWSCAFGVDTKVVRVSVDSVQKDPIFFDAGDLQVGKSGVIVTKTNPIRSLSPKLS